MVRVFISYAREDCQRVETFVSALRDAAYEIWWDRSLQPGTDWSKTIERELRRADCVVIFWSQYSVESPWARIEAHYALQHDCLIPVQLDHADIPDEYRMLQTIDGMTSDPVAVIPQISAAIRGVTGRQRKRWIKLIALPVLAIAALIAYVALPPDLRTTAAFREPPPETSVPEDELWREMQEAATAEELEIVENRFEALRSAGKRPVLAYSGLCASALMRYQLTLRDADLAIAESHCNRANELDNGSSARAAEANGWLAFYTGDAQAAENFFRRSLAIEPFGATAKLGLGATLEALGQIEEAEEILVEGTVSRPGLWRAQNGLALFLQRQGRTEESIRRLELALSLAPGNISILNNLGVSHLFNQDYGSAIAAWNRVLEITPLGDHGPTLSNIGSTYYLMRDFGAARVAYEKAGRLMGDDYRTWENLADTLSALGETGEAERIRRRALDRATLIYRENSGDLQALAAIASAKSALAIEDWKQDIEIALSIQAGNPEIQRIAALCFVRAGDLEKAAYHYSQAVRLGYPESLLAADVQFDGISSLDRAEPQELPPSSL